ncbi:unnamed protein product [Adineta ricciae]|uniref:F-box domain-containing protein n=1 Tax=Adineta ricciae TaxID=249248 RepID=A0A815G4I4_ADIRI|nr:unnamed protein product [Adineta ricciae]CAF1413304.1 unnamed protein product [Adineta ricciae]
MRTMTYFEDLSTEIIFEIFEYLDFCHTFKTFSGLNYRFYRLFHDPLFPIKIELSSMSKLTFQHYYTNNVIPHQQKIKSLQVSSAFMVDSIFSPNSAPLKLVQLKQLTLHNVSESKYFYNLLQYIPTLSNITSLILTCKHQVENKSLIYEQIFRIPRLKYCRVSFDKTNKYDLLPLATNEFSPIETFIINDRCSFSEFYIFLSYVPKLRRLTIPNLSKDFKEQITSYTIPLKDLKYLSVDSDYIDFGQFEVMVRNIFPSVEVLHMKIEDFNEYFDANRWEQLVTDFIPHLRNFKLKLSCYIDFFKSPNHCMKAIEQFNSTFWSERRWFFDHIFDDGLFGQRVILYSKKFSKIK